MVPPNGIVPKDILEAYFNSTSHDSIRKWLEIVRNHEIDSNYVLFVFQQPLLTSDSMLNEVRNTIRNSKNRAIRHELPRALEGRKDDESVNLLIQLLSDSDPTTRYWAGHSLKGNKSPQLVKLLPDLIRNPDLRTCVQHHEIACTAKLSMH